MFTALEVDEFAAELWTICKVCHVTKLSEEIQAVNLNAAETESRLVHSSQAHGGGEPGSAENDDEISISPGPGRVSVRN